jgi:hypothetical protein
MTKRELHDLLIGFEAESLINGNIVVKPKYRTDSGGFMTRMALAEHIAKVLNAHYRQRRKRRAVQPT